MKTVYNLGKIDYNQTGRKINLVTVTFNDGADIRKPGEEYGMPTYRVGNGRNTDCICAGPLNFFEGRHSDLDDFPEIAEMPLYKLACYFADKYGLKLLKCYTRTDRELFNVLCAGYKTLEGRE